MIEDLKQGWSAQADELPGRRHRASGDGFGLRLDPLSLKLFVSVVERGSIAAAAKQGHIAPAAVSNRLSELEAALRTSLLKRTNKGAPATPAGIALLNLARRLLVDLDDIAVQMRDWSGGTRGQVRVFANVSAITQFLPKEIAAFLARYPQVDVHLQERISSIIVRAVLENEADVGICLLNAPAEGLEVLPYHQGELALIVPRGHALAKRRAVAFGETLVYDYVGLHTGSSINQALARASLAAQRSLRLRIQVTSYDALARMVEARPGIGVTPRAVALPLAKSLAIAVVTLKERWAKRESVGTDLRLGAAATRQSVLDANRSGELERKRVVFFATHGLMAGGLPDLNQPALALAATGQELQDPLAPLLKLEEVLGLKLNADWVVLSAFNTAAADGRAEEALSGLARGFFYAGSRSLLVTHWAVESESAKLLTTSTCEHSAPIRKRPKPKACDRPCSR